MPTDNLLRYKIGQMLIVGFEGNSLDEQSPIIKAIQTESIGGVILFDYHFQTNQFNKNIHNPDQVKQLNHTLQHANTLAHQHKQYPVLPLIISVDYEGGNVNRLKPSYGFPDTLAPARIAEMGDAEMVQTATAMANTLRELGFNLDFAPLIDVDINPNNPIIGKLDRSFSSDPKRVAHCAQLFVNAFAAQRVQCAFKHFPGHGSSLDDSHLGFVDVTSTWQKEELIPYQLLLSKPQWCQMIMTAHIINRTLDPSGLPATLSHTMLTKLLRETLHYDGVIITDDMQMKAISDHYSLEKAMPLAIAASADMFIFGNQLSDRPEDPKTLIDKIESQVLDGIIPRDAIDHAFKRIVRFKHTIRS